MGAYEAGTVYSRFTKEEAEQETLHSLLSVIQLLRDNDRAQTHTSDCCFCPSVYSLSWSSICSFAGRSLLSTAQERPHVLVKDQLSLSFYAGYYSLGSHGL